MYSLRILNCKYQTISFIFQDFKIITSLKALSFLIPPLLLKTIEDMADDVISFAQAYELQNIHLIGFSLGVFVALQVLLRAPELTSKAILAGTGGTGGVDISNVTKIILLTSQTYQTLLFLLPFPLNSTQNKM